MSKDFTQDDVFIGNPGLFRYKKIKGITLNPPSYTLHISNLIRECCREDFISNYFV